MHITQIRLIEAMKERGIRATDLSRATGLSKARISQYVNGKYIPKADAVAKMAAVLGVSTLWLLGEDTEVTVGEVPAIPAPANLLPLRLHRYPMLGEIACGSPILANEEGADSYVTAAEEDADFCLVAKGDSMIGARIFDGDRVFIQQTEMVRNGEIAAVVVEDDEATLKRVYYYPEEDKLVLAAENTAYAPLVFSGEELDHIRILGRAVAFQSRVR